MNGQVPTHQGIQQQGLGAPTAQNQYFAPNQALQAAQAKQANAQAGNINAERAVLEQAAMQQGLQAGPQVAPQEIQAQQIAEGIASGQLGQEQLGQMIQSGQVDQRVVEAAMGMAQAQEQQAIQQYNAQQGLGTGF